MRKSAIAASLLLLAAGLVSAQTGTSAGAAAPAGLTQIRQAFVTAANAKDAAALTALYTDDALLMPSNSPAVKGRAAIMAFWKGMLDQGARDVSLGWTAGALMSDSGYEAGTYTFTMAPASGQPASDKGKYLLTVKKGADGKWRINNDIFNSDLPCH
jgi:uncharacterized protein (TIGR02246 family)